MDKVKDWQYICVACSKIVVAGVGFAGSCPSCGSSHWLCHWLRKDCGARKSARVTLPGQSITPPKELLPSKRNGNSTAGPKSSPVPDDLIRQLAGQGLGCKAIAERLLDQGIMISHMTIHRRLQRDLL